MAVVELPSSPRPVLAWEPVDFGGTQQGALGGAAQRVNRLGNRWRAKAAVPAMESEEAMEWAATLTRALRLGAALAIVQPGVSVGSPGVPRVFGAGQTGAELNVDGLVPGYTVGAGRWLNVITGGRRYLYLAAQAASAGASGRATLAIEPLLRAVPADNDVVELAAPAIEGLLELPTAFQIDTDWIARGFSFTIVEYR